MASTSTATAMASSSQVPLRSEDTDSIMTDDVDIGEGEGDDAEGGGGVEVDVEGDEHDAAMATAASSSKVARPTVASASPPPPTSSPPPPSSSAAATPTSPGSASPPPSLLPPKHHHPHSSVSPSTTSHHFRPLVPVCEFGDRLGYTYFGKPLPAADALNAAYRHTDTHWFTVDHDLTYLSFFRDTGPLNVGCLYRFCLHLHELLEAPELKQKRVILFSSDEPDKKANAALLITLYAMIVLRWPAADALHPVAGLELQPFRDAGYARADFHLSLQDVIFGTRRAIDNRLLKLDEFNLQEYEHYEKVENGDWNFLTPHFLAFASPVEQGYEPNSRAAAGPPAHLPKINKAFRNVLDYFEKNNVRTVVRLNKKLYNERRFTERGMEHREMYFDDGTNPTLEMCRDFIDLSERVINAGGVIAVHCKAGLGRTGTLIGAYLIYKYGFSATEVIGFMRLMRPGTCVGPQQHFMYENQMTWVKWGAIDRYKADNPALLVGIERPITPPTDDEEVHSHRSARSLSTPRAGTPHIAPSTVQVPGQPRKTPGAKTRHAVAAPETADPRGEEDVFVDDMALQRQRRKGSQAPGAGRAASAAPSAAERDEEMQLVVDEVLVIPHRRGASPGGNQENQPAAYIATATGIREISPPTLIDSTGSTLSLGLAPPGSNSSASSAGTITASTSKSPSPSPKSTRIAKARQQQHVRPLTSISDNRQVDKIPTLAFNNENEHHTASGSRSRSGSANGSGMPRAQTGKAVGLGTVHEDGSASSAAANDGRYNLRAVRSKEALSSAVLPTSPSGSGPHSPSRLPQRVAGRRKAAVASAAKTANHLGAGHPPGAPGGIAQTRSASGSAAIQRQQAAAAAAAAGTGTGPARGRGAGRRRRSSAGEVA